VQSKEFDGVIIHFAETDVEWSASVLAKNNGRCVLCGRRATPAHVISRRYKKTRLVIENGVPLCMNHHYWFDTDLERASYEKMAVILVGDLFHILYKLSREVDEVKIWK
jgi:predicted restriction endonuclease